MKINYDFEVQAFFQGKKMNIENLYIFLNYLENLEKVMIFDDLGQNGGRHPNPGVKLRLYTNLEVDRTES